MLKQRLTLFVATLLALVLIPQLGLTQSSNTSIYTAAKTPWGHPDFQGVWDRRTITPLERPERLAGKAFMTPEEIIAYERESAARADGRPLDALRP